MCKRELSLIADEANGHLDMEGVLIILRTGEEGVHTHIPCVCIELPYSKSRFENKKTYLDMEGVLIILRTGEGVRLSTTSSAH